MKCYSIFPGRGSSEIGLRSPGWFALGTLGRGITVAIFHSSGYIDCSITTLNRCNNRSLYVAQKTFHTLLDIVDIPLDLYSFMLYVIVVIVASWGHDLLKFNV